MLAIAEDTIAGTVVGALALAVVAGIMVRNGIRSARKRNPNGKRMGAVALACIVFGSALLITGLIAEIFDIESILHWWIWSPPGSGW